MPHDAVTLSDTPAVAGLVFRPFRGESDFAPMQRVVLTSERPDEALEEDFPGGFEPKAGFDPRGHILLAEVGGEVVGYGRIKAVYEPKEEREYHLRGYVLPEWRRKGIGGALLQWLEDRVRALEEDRAAQAPGDAAVRVYTRVGAKEHQKGLAAMLVGAGYQPVRYYFLMTRPLLDPVPDVPLPAGIEMRPVLPEHYRAVWAAVVVSALDEGGGWTPSEADYQGWISDALFQPHLWQIGWDAAENIVAGHVLTYIPEAENALSDRKRGFTEGIGVVRAWRKRGLATALIARSLQTLRAAGMTESALVVDSANPNGALGLYERCGFRVVERNAVYRREVGRLGT